jgi:transketolase
MEQAMVGIAAGMAIGGMIPIVYSMPNFLCIRALEQIRNDIVLQNLNVKLLGTGAGAYLAHLGKSHCGLDLDANLMDLIGVPVWNGCGEWQTDKSFRSMVNDWITAPGYGYLRV